MRIFLIGFMGSGKTTVGKKLAAKLNYSFCDLDELISVKFNKSINDIFESEGEENFRKKENQVLSEIINGTSLIHNSKFIIHNSENIVLSTGGGTPCFLNNMELINNSGISVYLRMSPSALFSRLVDAKIQRPLLKNLNDSQLKTYINNKLLEREPFYQKAHLTVNAFSIDINKLIKKINSLKQ